VFNGGEFPVIVPTATTASFLEWSRAFLPAPADSCLDGYVHPDFVEVADLLRRQIASSRGGAALCVYHRGERVVDLWGGVRDAEGTRWDRDTLAPSFSTTKGVAATALHILVDRGALDYDDRVADHWPEFAQEGKDGITVRHVLTHQAGLYHIRKMIDRADRMLDWEYVVRAIEQARPVHEPGQRTAYHGLTFGYLVGELIQRVSGRSFSQVVQDEIADPLGTDGLYIGAPTSVLDRAASLLGAEPRWLSPRALAFSGAWLDLGVTAMIGSALRPFLNPVGLAVDVQSILDALAPAGIDTFDFGAHATLQATIPAANGLFTARALAKMYAALANGGEIDGGRLVARRTIERATERQAATAELAVIPFNMHWRLGYHGVFTTRGIPRNAFGHFGYGGSGAWADPKRRLAMALTVNSGQGTPFGDLRILRLSGAVLGSADARGRR